MAIVNKMVVIYTQTEVYISCCTTVDRFLFCHSWCDIINDFLIILVSMQKTFKCNSCADLSFKTYYVLMY